MVDSDEVTDREVDEAIERARELIRSMPTDEGTDKLIAACTAIIQAASSPADACQAFAIAASMLTGCPADVVIQSANGRTTFAYGPNGVRAAVDAFKIKEDDDDDEMVDVGGETPTMQ